MNRNLTSRMSFDRTFESPRGIRAYLRGIPDALELLARCHRHCLSRWVVAIAIWVFGGLEPALGAAVPDVSFTPYQRHFVRGDTFELELADLNRDGKLDLVLGTLRDAVFVCLGRGDGTFRDPVRYEVIPNSSGNGGLEIAIADVTKDGILHVLVTNADEDKLHIFPGVGDGTLGTPIVYQTPDFPLGLAVGDVYGDGDPDVVVACSGGNQLLILHNMVDGRFTQQARLAVPSPFFPVIRDFDSNGSQDLLWNGGGQESRSLSRPKPRSSNTHPSYRGLTLRVWR